MPTSADEAFEWDRRGAPQVRHSHAFLARLVGLLRTRTSRRLRRAARRGRHRDALRRRPAADDHRLRARARRRRTGDARLPAHHVRMGGAPLRARRGSGDVPHRRRRRRRASPPTPDAARACRTSAGVHLADGTTIDADLVVVAAGRRSALSDWLVAARRARVDEEVDDTGIVYFSRFYRLRDGHDVPPRAPGRSVATSATSSTACSSATTARFSVTLATPTDDDELRKRLTDPAVFDACAAPAGRHCARGSTAAPSRSPREVHVMAGLLNRWRDYVPGRRAGRHRRHRRSATPCCAPTRCTGAAARIAFWGAHLLADARRRAPRRRASAIDAAYDAALRDEIVPWYRVRCRAGRRGPPRRRRAARRRGPRRRHERSAHVHALRVPRRPACRRCAPTRWCCAPSSAASTCSSAPDAMVKDPDVRRPCVRRVAGPREPPARGAARPEAPRRSAGAAARLSDSHGRSSTRSTAATRDLVEDVVALGDAGHLGEHRVLEAAVVEHQEQTTPTPHR